MNLTEVGMFNGENDNLQALFMGGAALPSTVRVEPTEHGDTTQPAEEAGPISRDFRDEGFPGYNAIQDVM